MRFKLRKLLSAALILAFLANMLTPALAADKAEAVTIRLSKTEGKGVSVTTNADKSVKLSDNMRVFNGYKILTDKASYAFFSLDDKKAVKLDKSSEVEVKKSGDKNELYLSNGQLFFNVKEKLKDNEEVNVVTSNMVMGIRGTSGVVSTANVYDRNGKLTGTITNVQIYDGIATITFTNPTTGETETISLPAGSQLVITDYTVTENGTVVVKLMVAGDIPNFAAIEIILDEELAKRIFDDWGISLENIKEMLGAILDKELAINGLWQSQYDFAGNLLNRLLNENTDTHNVGDSLTFNENEAVQVSKEETKTDNYYSNSNNINFSSQMTAADFMALLSDSSVSVINIPAGVNIVLSTSATLSSGKTINLNGTLTLNGDLIVYGTFNNLSSHTLVMENGNVILKTGAVFNNGGSITGNGRPVEGLGSESHIANIAGIIVDGNAKIINAAGVTIPSVAITAVGYAHITNNGTINDLETENDARLIFSTVGTVLGATFNDEEGYPQAIQAGNEYVMSYGEILHNAEYNITYDLDGGTNHPDNISTFGRYTGLEFKSPTRPGKVFVGWYDATDPEMLLNEAYYNYSYGDIAVKAVWQEPISTATEFNAVISSGAINLFRIVLDRNVTVNETIQFPNSRSFQVVSESGKQFTLSRDTGFTDAMINYANGLTSGWRLELVDVVVDGRGVETTSALIELSSSNLYLYGKTVIKGGNNTSGNGGGIHLANGSGLIIGISFTGSISGNLPEDVYDSDP